MHDKLCKRELSPLTPPLTPPSPPTRQLLGGRVATKSLYEESDEPTASGITCSRVQKEAQRTTSMAKQMAMQEKWGGNGRGLALRAHSTSSVSISVSE